MNFIEHLINGGKVKTKDGYVVNSISIDINRLEDHPIKGYLDCKILSWTKEGKYYHYEDSLLDLVVAPASFKEKALKELEKVLTSSRDTWQTYQYLIGIESAIRTIKALEE